MSITFDLLKKIAAMESISYNFIKKLATSPIPGEVYNSEVVQESKVRDYLQKRITAGKTTFASVDALLEAATSFEIIREINTTPADFEPVAIGSIITSANKPYTVVFSNNQMALGYCASESMVAKAYKVFSLRNLGNKVTAAE